MTFRSFVMALIVLVLGGAISLAQETTTETDMPEDTVDTCFGLAEADCTAIADAYAASDYTSFYQTFSIDFSITGVPDLALSFSVTGEGPFALDETQAFGIQMMMPMQVSFSTPEESASGMVEVRFVGDNMYLFNENDGWGVINVDYLLSAGTDQLGVLGDFGIDPEALLPMPGEDMDGDMGDAGDAMDALGGLPEFDLGAFLDVPGFITYVREGDTYIFTTDITALINDPAFQELLFSPEVSADVAFIGGFVQLLIDSGLLTVVQEVDPISGGVTGIDFSFNLGIDTMALTTTLQQLGGTGFLPIDPQMLEEANALFAGGTGEPFAINLEFSVDVTQVNETFEFAVPDGEIVPIELGDTGMDADMDAEATPEAE